MPQEAHVDTEQPKPVKRSGPRHAAAEGARLHPLIDLSRDPTPGVPGHARPENEE